MRHKKGRPRRTRYYKIVFHFVVFVAIAAHGCSKGKHRIEKRDGLGRNVKEKRKRGVR